MDSSASCDFSSARDERFAASGATSSARAERTACIILEVATSTAGSVSTASSVREGGNLDRVARRWILRFLAGQLRGKAIAAGQR